jgi:excisionase family DNA binding protein
MTELITLRQAARGLGIAERVVRQAVRNGELPAYRLGKRTVRVKSADLDDWIQNRRVRPWSGKKR